MSEEIWKDVPGYGGDYQISNRGRVRSYKGVNQHVQRRTVPIIRKTHQSKLGYIEVRLSDYGDLNFHLVHRLVALAFLGPCPDGYQVNHKNGNRSDNRVENLEYVTPGENVRHSMEVLGELRHGEHSAVSKLTERNVRAIRRLIDRGEMSYREIGEKFDVTKSTINQINRGENWGWLD